MKQAVILHLFEYSHFYFVLIQSNQYFLLSYAIFYSSLSRDGKTKVAIFF